MLGAVNRAARTVLLGLNLARLTLRDDTVGLGSTLSTFHAALLSLNLATLGARDLAAALALPNSLRLLGLATVHLRLSLLLNVRTVGVILTLRLADLMRPSGASLRCLWRDEGEAADKTQTDGPTNGSRSNVHA